MNNIFPLHETVRIEEVYGKKRTNALPPASSKTYVMSKNPVVLKYTYCPPQEYEWFEENTVSSFERNALSFLKDDKNFGKQLFQDDDYLKIRNKIIDSYKSNLEFVSLGSIYSLLGGSFNIVSKVFSFLEGQRIINNRNVLNECKLMIDELMKSTNKDPLDPNHGSNVDTLLDIKGKDPKSSTVEQLSSIDLGHNCLCGNEASYRSKDKLYICCDCYDKGLFSNELTSSDFQKLDENILKRIWSKKEEIKLLEAVDNFGDDWKRVATHVETKNAHECVLYFINMAIQEKNLKGLNFSTRIPFIKTPNPIMYLVTFICSVVHPSLGSVAAHEAMINIDRSSIHIVEAILKKVKSKAKDLIELEKHKINRINLVLEEAMVNLINLKTMTYRDLCLSEEKVRQELIDIRAQMMEEDYE